MRRTLTRVAAASVVGGALVVAAIDVLASYEATAEVRHLIAGRRGITVADVSFDLWSGATTIRGLSAEPGAVRIHIGALRLPARWSGFGLIERAQAAADGAPAATGSAVADDVVVTDGPVIYRLKHIELSGTSLGNADLAALLDPKTADTWETRLRKLDAASILVPELTGDSAVGASEQHWTQKQIVLGNVVAGKAAVGSAAGGTFAIKDAHNASNGEIGGIQMTSVDLGQIAHVVAGTRTDENEPLKPLYESVAVNAIKITDVKTNQTFTIAALKESGLRGRAFKDGLQGASAKLANAKPTDPAAVDFLHDALHSLATKTIEVDDVAYVPRPGDATAALSAFGLSRFTINDFGEGRIGAADLNGLRVAGKSGMVSVTSASLSAFSFPSGTATNGAGAGAAPSLEGLKVDGVHVDVATSPGPPAQRFAFDIAHVGYAAPGFVVGQLPAKADLAIEHVVFGTQAAPLLALMGYTKVDASSAVDSVYDAAKQLLAVDKFTLSGVGMGALDLKFALANVGNDVASQNPVTQKAAVNAVLVRGVDLVVRNDGLIDKAIGLKATLDGVTPVQERDSLADIVAVQLPMSLNNSPKAVTIGTALGAFVRSPKTLHISLASPAGLAIADLSMINDPNSLLSVLDVQATANE